MNLRFFVAFFLMSLLGSALLQAQSNANRWNYVSTEYVKVWFQGEDRLMASRVAKYAERARAEVKQLYDFRPKAQYTIYYFPHAWAQRSSLLNISHMPAPGEFAMLIPEVSVVHPGTQAGLYKEVKRVIARLALEELSGGNNFFPKLQSHAMLYSIPWYSEGVTAYVGEGWTEEDEMRLGQLLESGLKKAGANRDKKGKYSQEALLKAALNGDEYLNTLARKSLWHFVAAEYGEEKIAEIIYLADISHSLNIGSVSVLGITLPTLTGRWQQYCLELVEKNASGRRSLDNWDGKLRLAPVPQGVDLLGFAYEPVSDRYALYLGDHKKQQVVLWKSGEDYLEETPVIAQNPPRTSRFDPDYTIPMAWSKDGRRLVVPSYQNETYSLSYLNLEESELLTVPVQSNIGRITSIDWSHDGALLVLSGLYRDRSAVFMGSPESSNFKLVSRDAADYLEPIFSYDDKWLYFVSNRSIDTVTWELEKDWTSWKRGYDLWGLDREADTILRITNTPYENERKPHMINSFELWYSTNYSGIPSVARYNLFLNQSSLMTHIAPGLFNFDISENRLVLHTMYQGLPSLLDVPTDALAEVPQAKFTISREAWLAKIKKAEEKKRREQAPKEPNQAPIIKSDRESKTTNASKSDSTKKKKTAARYYIFDDDVTPYEVNSESKKSTRQAIAKIKKKPSLPKLSDIEVAKPMTGENRWETKRGRLIIDRDPLAGYRLGLGVQLADRFHRQSIDLEMGTILGLYANFRGGGGEGKARYTMHRKRFDHYVEASARMWSWQKVQSTADSIQNRYIRWNLGLGTTFFPIRDVEIDLQANFVHIGKKDRYLLDRQRSLTDASDNLAQLQLNVAVDKHRGMKTFPTGGYRFFAQGTAWQGLGGESTLGVQRLEGDFRKYTSLPGGMVLASRIKGGIGFGDPVQRFYVGGTEGWVAPPWLIGREDVRENQDNSLPFDLYGAHFVQSVSPVRGFWFFSRSGDKYVVMNHELRIPIGKLNRRSLPEKGLYKISFVPFFDIGTAWTEGNPFSSRNKYPTETRTITNGPVTVDLQTLKSPFIMGFGGGIHTEIWSYLLKIDVAWSVDDNTLQSPAVMISLGERF
jgi:hypothetical protein